VKNLIGLSMNKIYCFGDSFIEHPNEDDSYIRWQYLLQRHFKDYEYVNFAKGGTGSIYSMQLFIEIEDKIKENDIVVFHLSYKSREYIDDSLSEYNNVVDNNSFFCTYLYHMSQLLKFKLILFAVDIQQPSLYELNNDYFHLSKIDLFRETQRELLSSQWDEWIENKETKYFHDNRTNHMSEDNHKIMAEYIINVIEKKELPYFKTNYKTLNDLFFPKEYVYE
tara:strand:- start:48 stop:716 length:669 start_codon:yes stop_codon:yes gene_type:complete